MGRKALDMTGWIMKDHGVNGSRVTVIQRVEDYIGSTGFRESQWECLCECGTIFTARGHALRDGETRSCGCLLKETVSKRTFRNLTGQKFGKLTVLYRTDDYIDKNGQHRTMWHCLCECGKEKDIRGTNLTSGSTKSCGCLQKEDKKGTVFNKQLRQYDQNGNIIGHICSCCKTMLPINNFYRDSKTADGYSNICKTCMVYSVQARYQMYRFGAKKRNLEFELTRDEFEAITSMPCHYCGEYSSEYLGKKYSGVDRINSLIGYTHNNVVPCCTMCNRMKLDYTTSDWLSKMAQILKHMGYKENSKNE